MQEQLRPNTSMLVKASHAMRFERLTEELTEVRMIEIQVNNLVKIL